MASTQPRAIADIRSRNTSSSETWLTSLVLSEVCAFANAFLKALLVFERGGVDYFNLRFVEHRSEL